MIRWNRYLITALFGVASLTAGCTARDVEVSQRGPIRGEATVEGDSSSSRSRSESTSQSQESQKKSTSGSASGSASGSGSTSSSRSSSTTE